MTPFRHLIALALIALAPAVPAMGQEAGGGSAYAIGGIDVDVTARTAAEARMAGYRLAQRRAWPQLWARLTGQPPTAAPGLSDGAIDAMVAGIESQGEHFSTTRYIARLGVIFDRARASAYFTGTAGALHSPPMLLLPVEDDGAAAIVYQAKTPWRAAWQRFREVVSPVDYVLASGSAGDNLLLTAYQVSRPDRNSWRNILNRFDAVDVLSAEAHLTRAWPGGPVKGLFIARHGPDAEELGRFTLEAANVAGLDTMLDAAVRQVDQIYADAVRSGRLKSEPDLANDMPPIVSVGATIGALPPAATTAAAGGLDVSVATPDSAAVDQLTRQLRAVPTVTGVTLRSLSLGGASRLIIGYSGTYEMVLYQLDQRGWRVVKEAGGNILRRRLASEAPLPAPVTASEAAEGMVVDETEGDAAPVPAAKVPPPRRPPPAPPAPAAATRPIAAAAPAPPSRAQRRAPTEPAAAPPPKQRGPRDLLPPGP